MTALSATGSGSGTERRLSEATCSRRKHRSRVWLAVVCAWPPGTAWCTAGGPRGRGQEEGTRGDRRWLGAVALPLFPARRPRMRPTAPEGSPAVIRERPRQSDRVSKALHFHPSAVISVCLPFPWTGLALPGERRRLRPPSTGGVRGRGEGRESPLSPNLIDKSHTREK